nr:hypothetical protein GCM10020092_059870 [Actinoplanes digitatis]
MPFRSVGALLLKTAQAREVLDLTVLRPPTFAALSTVLEQAHDAGRPFHAVHFDGHGTYLPSSRVGAGAGVQTGAAMYGLLSPLREGTHGYLLFEDPTTARNQQLVDGPALGALLARTGVGVLVLNACRSAYAEAAERPRTDRDGDVHALVRGYGSLALEVSDAGVAGVVAMRYSVYVVTAAQFVADLYAALLAGRSLGGAVSASRRQLAAQPNRSIAFDPRPLQDWSVPVVYETAPVTLLRRAAPDEVRITVGRPGAGMADAGTAGLLAGPEVGFFGRDETLLALDRAFDTDRIVLLHAYAEQREDVHGLGVRPLVHGDRRAHRSGRHRTRCGAVLVAGAPHAVGGAAQPARRRVRPGVAGQRDPMAEPLGRQAAGGGPPGAGAGAGAVDLGQRRAGRGVPGRDTVGVDRGRAARAARLPPGDVADPGAGAVDLAARRARLAR